MKKYVEYCTTCGEKLVRTRIGAEEIIDYMYYGSYHPYTAYDSKTGERNWGYEYKCPNYRRSGWFSTSHYQYHSNYRSKD